MLDVITLALIALLGAMSPGPDFAIVTRYALTGSRKAALLASLGISAALLVHVTYCVLGIGILLVESPLAFRVIQIIGSCYLGYLGIRLLFPSKAASSSKPFKMHQAFVSGFLTNVLNPKAALFILSIFTQFVHPGTSHVRQAFYGLVISATAMVWFSTLSFLITHHHFLPHFKRFQTVLMKVMGCLLLGLGLYVIIFS